MVSESGFAVGPVRPSDAPQWLRMRRALWPEEEAAGLARDVEAFLLGGVHGLHEVLLARDADGTPIGFAELNIRPYAEGCVTERVAYLEGWFVDAEHRRRGVGALLIRAAERWGAEQGCTEFASDALADNAVSAKAHVALGFEEVETIRCFRKTISRSS